MVLPREAHSFVVWVSGAAWMVGVPFVGATAVVESTDGIPAAINLGRHVWFMVPCVLLVGTTSFVRSTDGWKYCVDAINAVLIAVALVLSRFWLTLLL